MFVKAKKKKTSDDNRDNTDISNLVADSQNVLKIKLTFPHIFQTNFNYTVVKKGHTTLKFDESVNNVH